MKPTFILFIYLKNIYLFYYLFILTALGLSCGMWDLHCSMWDLLVVACGIF